MHVQFRCINSTVERLGYNFASSSVRMYVLGEKPETYCSKENIVALPLLLVKVTTEVINYNSEPF
jgi:hypothetical protein